MRIENLAMEIGAFVKTLTGVDLFDAVDTAYAMLDSQALDTALGIDAMAKLVMVEMGATI